MNSQSNCQPYHHLLLQQITNAFFEVPLCKRRNCEIVTNFCFAILGYSFVASNLKANTIEDDVVYGLGNNLTVRPNPLKVIKHRSRNSEFFAKYDLQSSQPIGIGTYSICMKCRSRENSESYAVKIVTAQCDVTDEVAALRRCQGPFVVSLIEVLSDTEYTYIVMELLQGGDLLQRAERTTLTERDLALVFGQIVRAVRHIHTCNVVHRDLKPENICFLSNDGPQVRVIDFGFAQCLNDTNEKMSKSCYTLDYAAPEVLGLFNGQTYTKACDLWSIGVLMYTLMCGHSPFRNGLENLTHTQSIHVIADRIRRGSFDFDSSNWLKISEPTKKMIKGLLHINPSERYTLEDIVNNDDHNHIKSEKLSNWSEPVKTVRCDINMVFKAQRETFRHTVNVTSQPEQLIKKSISTTSIDSSRHSSSNGGVLSRSSGHASYDQNNRSTSTATISSDTTELFNNNDKFDTTIVDSSNIAANRNNNLDHVKGLTVNVPNNEIEEDFYGFTTEDQNGVSEYVQRYKCVLQRMTDTKVKQSPISPDRKRRSNIQIRHNYLKVSQCHQSPESPQPSESLEYSVRNLNKRVATKTGSHIVDPVDPYFQRAIASGYIYGEFFNTSGLPAKRNRTNVNYKEIDDDVDIKKRRIRAFMKSTTNT